jgi:hypothetical protein
MWLGQRMATAADLDRAEIWHGGFYELVFKLGPTDEARLADAVEALWRNER